MDVQLELTEMGVVSILETTDSDLVHCAEPLIDEGPRHEAGRPLRFVSPRQGSSRGVPPAGLHGPLEPIPVGLVEDHEGEAEEAVAAIKLEAVPGARGRWSSSPPRGFGPAWAAPGVPSSRSRRGRS